MTYHYFGVISIKKNVFRVMYLSITLIRLICKKLRIMLIMSRKIVHFRLDFDIIRYWEGLRDLTFKSLDVNSCETIKKID